MQKYNFKNILCSLFLLILPFSNALAIDNNFHCPQSFEIQSTDFSSPSIWIAPPVPHSVPNEVGVGLGGKEVKEFLGAEAAEVNHRPGWVCVYRSKGGMSVREYEARIRSILESNHYLRKYLARVNKEIAEAEPYLKKYPQESALGFVGYMRK